MNKLELTLDLSGISDEVAEKLCVLDDIGLLESYILNTLTKEITNSLGVSKTNNKAKNEPKQVTRGDRVGSELEQPEFKRESSRSNRDDKVAVIEEEPKVEEVSEKESPVVEETLNGKVTIKSNVIESSKVEKSTEKPVYDKRALEFMNNMMGM